ncbi:cyclodeaminase/cyclohydrolase family protein [Sporolactobacillus nakayamae]|uniref:Formiminotetrahydrofolate cyclodeaminase n=1 Tax=Sporolactobacillus nakayamae TaxID=269670 RepID=A0A1I2N3L3_9BACL|nr:cyclodeaminase/cyclohydrolase family protein [Sporolactobacillus nakayamae]SFF97439.1 Formiminotetrahydrofolate cyclodeaminase [Sporolactobacillus nakayamae]
MKVFDQQIGQFIEAASSSAPTPGGGSIAALGAALGASMGAMVANLSTGPKFTQVQTKMNEIAANLQKQIHDFECFAQQDMDSFSRFMAALKLPKQTAEERTERTAQLQSAAIQAAEVPLHLMRSCHDAMSILEDASNQFNKNVISDLGVAVISLDAAIQSAWLTVNINLSTIKDKTITKSYQEQGTKLISDAQKIKQHVMETVMSKIG